MGGPCLGSSSSHTTPGGVQCWGPPLPPSTQSGSRVLLPSRGGRHTARLPCCPAARSVRSGWSPGHALKLSVHKGLPCCGVCMGEALHLAEWCSGGWESAPSALRRVPGHGTQSELCPRAARAPHAGLPPAGPLWRSATPQRGACGSLPAGTPRGRGRREGPCGFLPCGPGGVLAVNFGCESVKGRSRGSSPRGADPLPLETTVIT